MSSTTFESNNSNSNTPNTSGGTAVAKPNEAKGSQQGQTTLAAKVSRWEVLVNNLTKESTEVPKFQAVLDPFKAILDEAKVLRDQQVIMKAERAAAITRRRDVISQGNDLYGRLQLLLRGDLGPQNTRLHAFGLKPSRRVGRKPKTTSLTPKAPAPAAPAAPVAPVAPVATQHAEPQK